MSDVETETENGPEDRISDTPLIDNVDELIEAAKAKNPQLSLDDITPEDIITRGRGVALDDVKDSDSLEYVESFRELCGQYDEVAKQETQLKEQRNGMVQELKDEHNLSFTAIAEMMGVTSSLVLYLYERASGKSAKEIREQSVRSNLAKQIYMEKAQSAAASKLPPEVREFKKQQKEALKAFMSQLDEESNGSDEGYDED